MTVVGFDFGTTNSLVSVVDNERVYDLLDDGQPVPSVVKYEGVRKVVGQEAKDALDAIGLGVHGNFVKSPKTYLGDETITVGGIDLSPIDVTHDVIEHVRQRALASSINDGYLSDITDAVATIPVDMNGPRRRALREAYARAGIRVVQFVHEPFAALYGHFRPRIGTDFVRRFDRKNILVVDWGGGTLDLTLCRLEDGRVVQLQNAGTGEIGGDVFDDALRNWVLTHATDGSSVVDSERRRQLRHKCEQLKIYLSNEDSATLYIRNFNPSTGTPLTHQMTRAELETIAKPMIDRAMDHVVALLDAAHVSDSQVALCLVTGGMSRMPAISARLREFFGAHRVEVSQNSATVIAQGAAWIAYDRQQLELAKDIEVRLARGSFHRLLKAGTPVPFEGQELSDEALELYCADPRDGHAKFQFCTPSRPGGNAQRSDPRDELGNLSLDVDSAAKPFIERLTLRTVIDADGVLHATAMSDLQKDRETTSLHELEFGISLGSVESATSTADDPGPLAATDSNPEPGDIVVRSNLAEKKDDYYVPGELLYTYNSTYFSRAKNPPQVQVDERLYYQPCAICKRQSNDPECRCGSGERSSHRQLPPPAPVDKAGLSRSLGTFGTSRGAAMSQHKIIVCLANSRKHSGRCIAGIEIVNRRLGGWVRPVSGRPGAAVYWHECQYEDGSDPRVLDVLSVPLIEAVPDGYQVENWALDPDRHWVRKGRVKWEDLARLESDPAPLWPSTAPSTYYGMNDRVSHDDAGRFDNSLRLIRVEDLVLRVFAPGTNFGNANRRVQGGFTFEGVEYRVWVTDPVIERDYLAQADGDYQIGACYLTMSLGERSDDGYCYKLIAAVISRDRLDDGV